MKRLTLLTLVMVQAAALLVSGCQTAKVRESDDSYASRAPAQTTGGITAAVEMLARSSSLTKFEVTQVIQRQVLGGSTIASVVGTAGEAAAVARMVEMLSQSNSPLAAALGLSGQAKSTAIADLKSVQQTMAAAAGSGTDVGRVGGGGFGIPQQSGAWTQADLDRLTARLDGQLKKHYATIFKNAQAGAQRSPANEKALKRILKTGAQLAAARGEAVLGEFSCIANGDLSDPEALENLAKVLEKLVGNTNRSLASAYDQASQDTIGRKTRCQLVGKPCDVLDRGLAQGCGE